MSKSLRLLWMMLAAVFVLGLWMLNIEITYRRNVRNMPAAYQPRHHAITRLWKT